MQTLVLAIAALGCVLTAGAAQARGQPTNPALRYAAAQAATKPATLAAAKLLHASALRATQQHLSGHGVVQVASPLRRPAASTAPQGSEEAAPRTVSPVAFGADPTGRTDSTAAFAKAVAVWLNTSGVAPVPMASGIANLGGATLDLEGGEYLIAAPIVIPVLIGNVRVQSGTLRASPSFPADRFLLEVGEASCKPKDNQGVCNEFVGIEDVFLDAGHVAAGCVVVYSTMGTTVGPSIFLTGFNVAGLQVVRGHETLLFDAWVAEYFWSEQHPKTTCVDGQGGSIGVRIDGEDNYVTDTIIFDFTCMGVLVNGGANYLQGVHSWNGGGLAISVNGSYDVQDRVLNCYLDYSTLDIVNPRFALVQGNFFYNSHAVLVATPSVQNVVMRENIYSLNQYGGNRSIVITGTNEPTCKNVVVEDDVDAQQKGSQPRIIATVASQSLYRKGTTTWTFDFADQLLFGAITRVSYTLVLDDGAPLVTHAARAPAGTTVTVETSQSVDATVHMTVSQCD